MYDNANHCIFIDTPKSDQHLISSYNISPESNTKVTRIMKMIKKHGSFWLLGTISLPAPWEMYRKQYEKYAYWC